MKTPVRFLFLFGLNLFAALCFAQPSDTPPQDIRATLRKMTVSQKMDMLEFLRNSGADLDREIQQVYEQLGAEKRVRANQYLELLNHGLDKVPRTTVTWNRDTIHYGEIEEGAIVLDSFRVTNTGVYPYLVRDVKTSCDCTVLQFPKFPVMPGETATVRIEFDSQGKLGPTTPAIVIYDNSGPNSRNILYFRGTVYPRQKKPSLIDN